MKTYTIIACLAFGANALKAQEPNGQARWDQNVQKMMAYVGGCRETNEGISQKGIWASELERKRATVRIYQSLVKSAQEELVEAQKNPQGNTTVTKTPAEIDRLPLVPRTAAKIVRGIRGKGSESEEQIIVEKKSNISDAQKLLSQYEVKLRDAVMDLQLEERLIKEEALKKGLEINPRELRTKNLISGKDYSIVKQCDFGPL